MGLLRWAVGIAALVVLLEVVDPNWLAPGFWKDASPSLAARTATAVFLALVILFHVWVPLTFAPYVLAACTVGLLVLFPRPEIVIMAGVTSLFLLTPLRQRFQGETPNRTRLLRAVKFGFILVYLLSLGVFVLTEIPGLRSSVRAPRFETTCRTTKDPEACGQWAIHLIDHATHIDDVKRGHTELERLCKEGNKAACRHLTSRRSVEFFYESGFAQDLERDVNRLCSQGNMMACWVLPMLTEGIPPMGFVELHRLTHRACEARPDFFACETAIEVSEKVPNAPAISLDLIQWETPIGYCHGHDDPSLKKCCLEGNAEDCKTLARKTEDPAARILGATREVGFLGFAPDGNTFDSNALKGFCDSGESMACLAFAIQETSQPLGLPVRDEDREIWETYLKAPCEAGVDGACLAYAIRMLDIPVDERRDIERARAALEMACDRQSTDACWWLVVFFDDYEELALVRTAQQCFRTRSHSSPCGLLSDLVLKGLGLHPWRINRLVTAREYESQCAVGNPVSCVRHQEALSLVNDGYPKLVRRQYSEAEFACKKGYANACVWATQLSIRWPQKAHGLKDMYEAECALDPWLCNNYPFDDSFIQVP